MYVIETTLIEETQVDILVTRPKNAEGNDVQHMICIEPNGTHNFERAAIIINTRDEFEALVQIMKYIEEGFRRDVDFLRHKKITVVQADDMNHLVAAITTRPDSDLLDCMLISDTMDFFGAKESDANTRGGLSLRVPASILKNIARGIASLERGAIYVDAFTSEEKYWALPKDLTPVVSEFIQRAERKKAYLSKMNHSDMRIYPGWRMLVEKIFAWVPAVATD